MAFPTKEQREASGALVSAWGIVPESVLANEWNERGYNSPIQGEPGAREHHDWPDGFPVEKLIEIRGGFQ